MKFLIKELAEITNSKIYGNQDHIISNVSSLENADLFDVSFLANSKYKEQMKKSKAGLICIDDKTQPIKGRNFLISQNPSETFQIIIELFTSKKPDSSFYGISEDSYIHHSVKIGKNVTIAPKVTIDQKVSIGDDSFIYPGCFIGSNVKIGNNCILYSNVTIREGCEIGNNVIIQPGAVIGSCGFGFIPKKSGGYTKLKQLGTVMIEDNVEIGANTAIDRARFHKTIIKKGSKIDNLVQIAHNVEIGENNLIIAQSGFAGSSKTEENVIIGGQVGISGHLTIKKGTQIAAKAGVSKDLLTGKYRGCPAIPLKEYNRNQVHLRNIKKLIDKISQIEKKLDKISN
ncbi:MAG: UDP-3-O-(3-hydroxymyristoyl) glucosamine N-acyltransferase [Chlamydiae bacterium SM23_39]|nr:MAG: UDP-3-O-(3-hydroxymyristoyl) glucosamine N-acyltransferase [Chlamydiae bacterium SM23_39]